MEAVIEVHKEEGNQGSVLNHSGGKDLIGGLVEEIYVGWQTIADGICGFNEESIGERDRGGSTWFAGSFKRSCRRLRMIKDYVVRIKSYYGHVVMVFSTEV
jgi:hypothetical protein